MSDPLLLDRTRIAVVTPSRGHSGAPSWAGARRALASTAEEDTVIKRTQFACRKCGKVATVDPTIQPTRVVIDVKNGVVREHLGVVEIRCARCGTALAELSIREAQQGLELVT